MFVVISRDGEHFYTWGGRLGWIPQPGPGPSQPIHPGTHIYTKRAYARAAIVRMNVPRKWKGVLRMSAVTAPREALSKMANLRAYHELNRRRP